RVHDELICIIERCRPRLIVIAEYRSWIHRTYQLDEPRDTLACWQGASASRLKKMVARDAKAVTACLQTWAMIRRIGSFFDRKVRIRQVVILKRVSSEAQIGGP